MKTIFGLGVALALAAVVGCGTRNTGESDSMATSARNAEDVSRFLGEYELIADTSGTCKKRDYSKIKISHPKVVTGINYDDPRAPTTLGLEKDSLEVTRLQESKELALNLGHTQINGEARQVVGGFAECSYYRARLDGDTVSTSTKGCLQLFGWELSHQMTLKGETLTISRPHPSSEYNLKCTYKRIQKLK
jgi:hypothetical protein